MSNDDRPPCTCLRLPMGPGQTCEAHQLPAQQPDPAAGPTVAEAAADDRRWWNGEKHGDQS